MPCDPEDYGCILGEAIATSAAAVAAIQSNLNQAPAVRPTQTQIDDANAKKAALDAAYDDWINNL